MRGLVRACALWQYSCSHATNRAAPHLRHGGTRSAFPAIRARLTRRRPRCSCSARRYAGIVDAHLKRERESVCDCRPKDPWRKSPRRGTQTRALPYR
eukprot:7386585-Prymnesium_polylepis.5